MTERLTTEFLRASNVNFHVDSVEELIRLQEELLRKGVIWADGAQVVQKVNKCMRDGLNVGRGLIYSSHDTRQKHVSATLRDLLDAREVVATPPGLDRAFFHGKAVVFEPKTIEEAAFIQGCMFKLGIYWRDGQQTTWEPARCVEKKIKVANGVMTVGFERSLPHTIASIQDLAGYHPDKLLSAEQILQRRVALLEGEVKALRGKIGSLLALLEPQEIKKLRDTGDGHVVVQRRPRR